MPNQAFFLMRLNDHIQYLKNIEATLVGDGNFQGTSHLSCKLGQWLYAEGAKEVMELKNPKAKEVFDSLFEPHERFHTISHEALAKHKSGDKGGAQAAITEMHQLSHLISQKLLELDALASGKLS
jgi:hypothetical protein